MPERVFLMFDYESSGLWYADGDRAAGMVDPDALTLSEPMKARLAAWVQRCDDLNMQGVLQGREPSNKAWKRADEEAVGLWRAIRAEAAPGWIVGIRRSGRVAWDESELD